MKKKSLQPSAELALLDYPWPGNVRELKHAIERAYILNNDEALKTDALFEDGLLPPSLAAVPEADLNQYLQACERRYIVNTLGHHQWHMGNTAAALGISRKNLWEKIKKLEIQADIKGINGD